MRAGVSLSGLKPPTGCQEGFDAGSGARVLHAVEYSNAKTVRVFHSKAAKVALEYWGAEKAFEFSRFPVDGAEFQLAFQIKLIAEYEAMHPPTSQHRTGRWAGRSMSGTEKLASSRPVTVFRCAGLFFLDPRTYQAFA